MDDKKQTEAEAAQTERAKGAELEYDAEDEDSLADAKPAPSMQQGADAR